jgi:hypothetical protein
MGRISFRLMVVALSSCLVLTLLLHAKLVQNWHGSRHDIYFAGAASVSGPIYISPLILDVLSIGSLSRIEFLETQRNILTSSHFMRRYFNATERDDFDPSCSFHLTNNDTQKIKRFCRTAGERYATGKGTSTLLDSTFRDFSRYFLPRKLMAKKRNPASWLCAQQRPLSALRKTLEFFRRAPPGGFPDYLMIIDDDTYIDPENIHSYLKAYEDKHSISSDNSIALTGCVAKLRTIEFGHGGFGLILSRGALALLDAPLTNHNNQSLHTILSPWTKKSKLELKGLSLIELFAKIAKDNSFVHHQNWTFPGYCMHSDWVLAYILRYGGIASINQLTPDGFCQMTGDKCLKTFDNRTPSICHFASPAIMQTLRETKASTNTIVMY